MSGSEYKRELEALGALDIVRVLTPGASSQEYVCYTTFSEQQWVINVSDGESVWRAGLREGALRSLKAAMSELSDTLCEGQVELHPVCGMASLSIHCPGNTVTLDLIELAAAERTEELRSLVLNLSKRAIELRTELAECRRSLDSAEKTRASRREGAVPDMPMRGSGKVQSKPRKPVGHSIVNPSSKRRKAATGVVFGGGEDQ